MVFIRSNYKVDFVEARMIESHELDGTVIDEENNEDMDVVETWHLL